MRTVQEIFDAVIAVGLYPPSEQSFMCCSLTDAETTEVITGEEAEVAVAEIEEYLEPPGWTTLKSALSESELPDGYEHRLAIYKDWANRPKLGGPDDRQ